MGWIKPPVVWGLLLVFFVGFFFALLVVIGGQKCRAKVKSCILHRKWWRLRISENSRVGRLTRNKQTNKNTHCLFNFRIRSLEYVLLSDYVILLCNICIINDHFYSSVLCYVDISSLLFGVKLNITLSGFYKDKDPTVIRKAHLNL